MHRTIRLATYDDLPAIMPVIDAAREMMHNKSIQKAIESYRITDEQKALLRTFRVK